MQQTGNLMQKLSELDIETTPDISEEEQARLALEKAIRESFTRIYLPSGVIFLSVKKGRWSFYFGGNYANPPKRVVPIGEAWTPAAGPYRMRYEEGVRLLHFLWDFLTDNLNPKVFLDMRNEERALRIYQDQENRSICIQYIDNGQFQSTKFFLEDYRILDLYLGMLAGFRFMMRGKFANSEAQIALGEQPDFEAMELISAFPLGRYTVDMVLKNRHLIIRNAVVNNEIFRITQAHAPMLAHGLTAHLNRGLRNRIEFSDYMKIDLPGVSRTRDDDLGNIVLGQFRADFSRINTPFLVAMHLGVTHLIDGLPMSIYR